MDFLLFQVQEVAGMLDGLHILDALGGASPAALIYVYFAERRKKEMQKEIDDWKAEADKYQGKWIEAVEQGD